jgi:hypothetical protein
MKTSMRKLMKASSWTVCCIENSLYIQQIKHKRNLYWTGGTQFNYYMTTSTYYRSEVIFSKLVEALI